MYVCWSLIGENWIFPCLIFLKSITILSISFHYRYRSIIIYQLPFKLSFIHIWINYQIEIHFISFVCMRVFPYKLNLYFNFFFLILKFNFIPSLKSIFFSVHRFFYHFSDNQSVYKYKSGFFLFLYRWWWTLNFFTHLFIHSSAIWSHTHTHIIHVCVCIRFFFV